MAQRKPLPKKDNKFTDVQNAADERGNFSRHYLNILKSVVSDQVIKISLDFLSKQIDYYYMLNDTD